MDYTSLDVQSLSKTEPHGSGDPTKSFAPTQSRQSIFITPRINDDFSVDGDEESKRIQKAELEYWNQQLLTQQEQEALYWERLKLEELERQKIDEKKSLAESFVGFLHDELANEDETGMSITAKKTEEPHSISDIEPSNSDEVKTISSTICADIKPEDPGIGVELESAAAVTGSSIKEVSIRDLEQHESQTIADLAITDIQDTADNNDISSIKDAGHSQEPKDEDEMNNVEAAELQTSLTEGQNGMKDLKPLDYVQQDIKVDIATEDEEEAGQLLLKPNYDDEKDSKSSESKLPIKSEAATPLTRAAEHDRRSGVGSVAVGKHLGHRKSQQHDIELRRLKRPQVPQVSKPPVTSVGKHEVKLLSLMNTKKL